jgi:hypothetical protein
MLFRSSHPPKISCWERRKFNTVMCSIFPKNSIVEGTDHEERLLIQNNNCLFYLVSLTAYYKIVYISSMAKCKREAALNEQVY